MSDRCSCVDGPNYRCGVGRPCDVHGSVEALMAWGVYVDRQGRTWAIVGSGGEWGLVDRRGFAMGGVLTAPDQMRSRIVREQHRDMCPGLGSCGTHPVVTAARGALGGWVALLPHHVVGRAHTTFAEAIDAAQRLAKEAG